jgi:signal transduction histidine kinase
MTPMVVQCLPANKKLRLELLEAVPSIVEKHFYSVSAHQQEFRGLLDSIRSLLQPAFETMISGIIDALFLDESDYREYLASKADAAFEKGRNNVQLMGQNINFILELGQNLHLTIQHELFRIIEPFAIPSFMRLILFDRISECCWSRFLGFSRGYLAANDQEIQNLHSRKISVMGQMATGMAHEVRNPLASIKGFSQLVKQKLEQPAPPIKELIQYLDFCVNEIDTIDQLISDFLILDSKSESKKNLFCKINLNEIIARSSTIAQHMTTDNRILIRTDIPDEPLYVQGISLQLEQLCRNLINNGIDALRDGGTLTVSIDSAPGAEEVVLRVSDNGTGIPEDVMDKIFEPFFTTKDKGTGIGLAICKQIVENHKGRIRVESVFAEGTIVSIFLPKQPPA